MTKSKYGMHERGFQARTVLSKWRILVLNTQSFLKKLTMSDRIDVVLTLKMKNEEIKTAVMNISLFESKLKPLLILKLQRLKETKQEIQLPVFESGSDELLNFGDVKYIIIRGDIKEAYINQSIVGTDTNIGY